MAQLKHRLPENISGDFYVDSSCIDCDTCRSLAPKIYHRAGNQSAVYHQPVDETERQQAIQALLSCPTASIGTTEKPKDIRLVQKTFPLAVEDNVYYCGYNSSKSYGAASYFIQRQEGNILVDSPRFTPPLVKRLEELGGLSYMYLTHKDDVADHQKFQQHFKCDRILHRDDITKETSNVEIVLSETKKIELAPDLLIIPVPGHTKGHTVLLYKNKFLFTGDHLAWSPHLNHLYAFRRYCWYSWSEQVKSMEKLLDYTFEWVLPGHGRRYHNNSTQMQQQM
ncbi:MAG: MBL fold metallo-hydrolase [Xenococcaceae cyanobacterium MO_207.B15]|nr:MBL fold metallo-hydrolase [Xenococcaceae cyanobacterium MO_207.B15]